MSFKRLETWRLEVAELYAQTFGCTLLEALIFVRGNAKSFNEMYEQNMTPFDVVEYESEVREKAHERT